MFDFWFELPPLLRAVMGIVMMGIAALIWYFSGGHLLAYGLAIVGFILLLFCKAGDSGGYKF